MNEVPLYICINWIEQITYMMMVHFLNLDRGKIKYRYVFLQFFLVSGIIIVFQSNFNVISLMLHISFLLYLYLQYREAVINQFIRFVIALIFLGGQQFIGVIILDGILQIQENNLIYILAFESFFLCIDAYLFNHLPIHKIYTLFCQNRATKCLTGNLLFVFWGVVIISWFNINLKASELLVLFIIFFAFAIMNIQYIIKESKYENQKREIESYKTYYPIIEQLMKEVRANQHDYKNHLQAMCSLPYTCDTYEEICDEITKYGSDIIDNVRLQELLSLDRKILAGFLYTKFCDAKKNDIKYTLQINNFKLATKISDYNLIRMLGILFDNAIEAEESYAEKSIYMQIYNNDNGKTFFIIKNKFRKMSLEELNQMWQKGFTTKEDNEKERGQGLYIIKKIAEENKGEIFIDNEEINGDNYISISVCV